MRLWHQFDSPAAMVAGLVTGLWTLTACGIGGDDATDSRADSSAAPDDQVTESHVSRSTPVPDQPESGESPEIEMPRQDAELVADMVYENSVGWEGYDVVSETELRFLATSGNQSCYGQRYQVEETQEEVAVAIIVGQRPDGADICTQEAIFIAVPVPLDEPLGGRDVVELEDPELNT